MTILAAPPSYEAGEQKSVKESTKSHSESDESCESWERQGSRYKCTICNVTRNTQSRMNKHIQDHEHGDDDGSALCRLCAYQTNSKDSLLEHIRVTHELQGKVPSKCSQCSSSFSTKKELTNHIKDYHKTHKPCDYFAEDRCNFDEDECGFCHIKLNQGEYICYKCGKIFKSKRDMMKHIEEIHGNDICHRFLNNECRVKRCFFSHNIHTATNVENSGRNMTMLKTAAPLININETFVSNQEDFPSLPTTGSVVRPQVQTQQTPHMSQGCQMNQNQIRDITAHAIAEEMKKIMPQIIAQLKESLKTVNITSI